MLEIRSQAYMTVDFMQVEDVHHLWPKHGRLHMNSSTSCDEAEHVQGTQACMLPDLAR